MFEKPTKKKKKKKKKKKHGAATKSGTLNSAMFSQKKIGNSYAKLGNHIRLGVVGWCDGAG